MEKTSGCSGNNHKSKNWSTLKIHNKWLNVSQLLPINERVNEKIKINFAYFNRG